MDYVDSFFSQRRTGFTAEAFKNFNSISPGVQTHLAKVYRTLATALVIASAGTYLHLLYNWGGLLSGLGFIGTALWLTATPPTAANETKRLNLLAAAAFCQGLSVGLLVEVALEIDSSLVFTAFFGSAAVFACFSAAALFARRREFLFLGGFISSALTLMAVMRLTSYFVGGHMRMFQIETYGGLLVFVGYVLFDTQVIIERASKGDMDYVKHALDLFVDFVSIFVRVLVILMKNAAAKEEKKEKRKSKDSRR
eukprot:TRINITY_DN32335_c0_g1_i1.p1 TRINITY_DN32335_c0_g1~~TRINITY_DN32335_c0_g1_i1.p1  ORF type:complete len:253 (-),score=59.58 TRINITY_DN32335_c0_g1_i1:406-1164(-)